MVPIVGITTGGFQESESANRSFPTCFVSETYIRAVRQAGGVPVLLPPGEMRREHLLSLLDAVVITGGADVQPHHYQGNSAHPALTRHDPQRDEHELALIRLLTERHDLPTLCICRGMQVMNVALGGSLYEHIPDIREQDIHRNAEGHFTVHAVHVENSRLKQIMGTDQVRTYSGHHQAVRQVAPDLQVVATAPDGIVEALENKSHPWMIGLQWHPEVSAADDPTQQALFDALVAAAHEKH
jgi:putative glutamine amidotransferase